MQMARDFGWQLCGQEMTVACIGESGMGTKGEVGAVEQELGDQIYSLGDDGLGMGAEDAR